MSKFSTAAVLELPVPERLQLVEDIWNSIADAPEALEVTEDEKRSIGTSNAGRAWATNSSMGLGLS